MKTEFRNQGEQEDYWAERTFYREYRKENFKKYSGAIHEVDANTFEFNGAIIVLQGKTSELNPILASGILYPQLFIGNPQKGDTVKIGSVEEMKFIKTEPTIKRFRLWLYRKGFANPIVYLF